MTLYKGSASKQEDLCDPIFSRKLNRRDLLMTTPVALLELWAIIYAAKSKFVSNSISSIDSIIHSISEEDSKKVVIDKYGNNISVQFESYNFKVVDTKALRENDIIVGETGLDGMLYRINNHYNPGFKIKGDKIGRLKNLFVVLNSPDIKRFLESTSKSECTFEYLPNNLDVKINNIKQKEDYHYPYYSLAKNRG